MGKKGKSKQHERAEVVSAPPSRAWPLLERWALPAAGLLVLACAFFLAAFPTRSDDLFMHLAVGRRFFETGSFPDPDPWLSSIPDYHRRWIDVAYWGAHLGAQALYELGGFTLISALKSALVVAGAAAPLWLARRLGVRSFLVPAALLLGLWAASNRFIERGSLVSDCLGPWALALVAAELVRPSRLRWLLPPLFLVWTNVHPGVLTGLVFLGCAALVSWRDWRRWAPLVGACALASVAHPDGARHLLWAVQAAPGASTGAFRKHNVEMMPTLSAMHAGTREVVQFLVLAGATWLALAWSFVRGKRPWFALLVLAALTVLGLSTVRYVTTAAMALPVVLVSLLALLEPARALAQRTVDAARNAALAAALVGLVAAGLCVRIAGWGYGASSGARSFGFGLNRPSYPFDAAEYLRSIPFHGSVFDEHAFGTFLCWLWDGHPKVHFHGYVLDEGFYERNYLAINESEADFDRIVNDFDVGAFLLRYVSAGPDRGPRVYRTLIRRPEWKLVHWDPRAVVFLRDRPEDHALVEREEYRYLDPFRPERLQLGLKEDPARVLDEAVRQAHWNPENRQARALIEQVFHKDAAALERERFGD